MSRISHSKRIVVNAIGYSSFSISIYGIWADFVPNNTWVYCGLIFSLFSSAIFLYWIARLGLVKIAQNINRCLQAALAYSFFFAVSFIAVVHGVGDILTVSVGNRVKIEALLAKSGDRDKRSCDFKLVGPSLSLAFPSHYCVSEAAFNSFPNSGIYKVFVSNSPIGFHIHSLEISR